MPARVEARRRAADGLRAEQEIPGGGTTGTANEHGVKTAQFLMGLHRTLHEYFRGVEES